MTHMCSAFSLELPEKSLGIAADGNQDPEMCASVLKILPGEALEVCTIVGQQRSLAVNRETQLLFIAPASLAGISCRQDIESPSAKQIGHQNVYVLVKIEVNEKATHKSLNLGSRSSSGMRFFSIKASISLR